MTYLEQNIVTVLANVVKSIDESDLTLGFYDNDNPCESFDRSTTLIINGILRDYIANIGNKE